MPDVQLRLHPLRHWRCHATIDRDDSADDLVVVPVVTKGHTRSCLAITTLVLQRHFLNAGSVTCWTACAARVSQGAAEALSCCFRAGHEQLPLQC